MSRTFDVSIAAYLINPLLGSYQYQDVAGVAGIDIPSSRAEILGKTTVKDAFNAGSDALQKTVILEAETAEICRDLLTKELEETGMYKLYSEIELPLTLCLKEMEENGVYVLQDNICRLWGRV